MERMEGEAQVVGCLSAGAQTCELVGFLIEISSSRLNPERVYKQVAWPGPPLDHEELVEREESCEDIGRKGSRFWKGSKRGCCK